MLALLLRVVLLHPMLVVTAGDASDPIGVVPDTTATVLRRPVSKVSCGFQPRSRRDLGGIDGVASVVTGTVCHVGDELSVRRSLADAVRPRWRRWLARLRGWSSRSSRRCCRSRPTCLLPAPVRRCACMVIHIEPVADVVALAVDGQRLAVHRVQDHQRDELLGELIRAVVVGAVGGDDGQAVGVVPGTHEVVAGRPCWPNRASWVRRRCLR